MSVRHTLATLAEMAERHDRSQAFSAHSWAYGALSIHNHNAVSRPAVVAIEKAHPDWREWTPEEAAKHLREMAGDPEVENAALAASLEELATAREALGKALGIHPASNYHLSQMIEEVAKRVSPQEPWSPGRSRPIPVHRRPESTTVDVPLPDPTH